MENLTPTYGNGPRITAEAITRTTRPLITMLKRGMALLFVLSAVLPVAAQTSTATDLLSFAAPNGTNPFAGLIQARDGNFYGTTVNGGTGGLGTVFKMTPSGVLTTLHSFSNADGANPYASLIQASDGNLYGTTVNGGNNRLGTIFKITTSGTLTTLYAFSGGSDGKGFYPSLLQASDGNLYGTTSGGGVNGEGTIFRITPSGTLTTLYAFSDSDGANPYASLIQASDGDLYGTTVSGGTHAVYGTVFKITLSGTLNTLYSFSGGSDGSSPYTSLIQASDGNLYGTTFRGGANGYGTIFQMTTGGTLTTLHSSNDFDGEYQYAGLIQASDGNLYGTTFQGGSKNDGTVFQITPSGTLTTLYAFSGSDGEQPYGSLLQASDGNLYGVTQDGGNGGNGVVFRLTGVYPVPALTGLSPASRNAGGPAFPLTVKGASFQPFSTIHWNGASLATTYVSASALKATVPASLIATPGTASITVITGAGGGTSKAKTFTILLTTLKLTAASLTKNSNGSYTANITLKNTGYLTAPSVKITTAILGAASTSTTLPVSAGSLAAGSTGSAALTFPASAGASGTVVSLKVSGTFTGGKFSGSLKVILP